MAVVLVAGVPGTGKSTFCERLQIEKGWIHLDIDGLESGSKTWPNAELKQSWNKAIAENNPAIFANKCKQLGNVIIDWGFPIHCISFVQGLANHGVKLLWFDGDVKAAKAVFANRGTVPLSAFANQMQKLNSINVPSAIGAKVIRVLEKGPQFMPHDTIYDEMLRS